MRGDTLSERIAALLAFLFVLFAVCGGGLWLRQVLEVPIR